MSESSNDSSTDSLLALVSLAGFVGVGFASVAAFLQRRPTQFKGR